MTGIARGRALAALLLASTPSFAASELDSARKDAQAGTTSLEQRPCPALGDQNYLRGLTNTQQLVSAADRERTYQDEALRQLQQMATDPQLSDRQRPGLQALASWSIAASMSNWAMLQLAQQALADPLVAQGRPYPTTLVESARDRLRRAADNRSLAEDAATILRRQATVLDRCAKHFGAAVFKLNQPQFDSAVDSASSAADLDRIELLYRARDAAAGNYGTDSLERVRARRVAIAEIERAERERLAAASAEEEARRQAENERRQAENRQRQAELEARLSGLLVVARRFTDAAASGNESAALAQLSPDVVMTTPQGSYYGINNVANAVRQQAASGASGSLGTPRIEGLRIVANGNSGGFRIFTSFGFDDRDKISRIDISL